jgi:hypothetical protein
MGLSSCFEGMVEEGTPLPHTTFNARTYLQPQLNKAIKLADRETSPLTDRNPKDFILFKKGLFTPTALSSDNDGSGNFDASAPFPTLAFPSDHAVLSSTLAMSEAPETQVEATVETEVKPVEGEVDEAAVEEKVADVEEPKSKPTEEEQAMAGETVVFVPGFGSVSGLDADALAEFHASGAIQPSLTSPDHARPCSTTPSHHSTRVRIHHGRHNAHCNPSPGKLPGTPAPPSKLEESKGWGKLFCGGCSDP